MKALIIEDEHLTAQRIRTLLLKIDPSIVVLEVLDSVKNAVQWFKQHVAPDLVFMDIQLADGLSFDIFEQVAIDYPIIFITAYQEYAIKAFKVNSVDYLLKPISEEDLRAAIHKYQQHFSQRESLPKIDQKMLASIKELIHKTYKTRFMIRVGDRVKSLEVDEILYIYSLDKGTYLFTTDKRNYVIDYTLDSLVDLLDPARFQRINRRYIITHGAISEIFTLSGSKLKVNLLHNEDDQIYISRERMASFKAWLDQ